MYVSLRKLAKEKRLKVHLLALLDRSVMRQREFLFFRKKFKLYSPSSFFYSNQPSNQPAYIFPLNTQP